MPTLKGGRYEIPEKWNTATMGRWVIGKDTTTGKPVFIKEFMNYRYPKDTQGRPELIRVEQRTEKFAEQMRKINDEVKRIAGSGGDVVVTTDFFREGVSLYKVTECVDKVEWSEDRAEIYRKMTIEQIDDMMLRIVFAISALHQAKLLHCDLKPENVFIVKKDGRYVGMVSDFDDSFFVDDVPNGADVVGTPEYMSPELALHKIGEEDEPPIELTAASDLFALGLMYHEYLTGDMPEFDTDVYGAVWEVMTDDSEEAGSYKLSDRLDIAHRMLIDRLIQPEPEDRIGSCALFAKAIKDIKMRRNREFKITVMNADRPLAGKEVSVYATYSVGSGEYKRNVTEKAFSANTGRDGTLVVKGLPADAAYQLRFGKEKKPLIFRETDSGYACIVQLGAAKPAVVSNDCTVYVTCDGKSAPRVKVTLGRKVGAKEQTLPAKLTDANGKIVFPKLSSEGSYWVECEGIRKAVTWDKNRRFTIALATHKVRVTRGGKGVETEVKLMLCGSGGAKRTVASGTTDASGSFSFRFIETAQPWKAVCEEIETDVEWSDKHECEIKLPCDVQLVINASVSGTDPRVPIKGVRMVVASRQDGKLKTIAVGNTDAQGRAVMGIFPEGEYYIGAVSAPAGYTPKKIKLKKPVKVELVGERVSKRITFEKVKKAAGSKDLSRSYKAENAENVKSDQRVPVSVSKKWGRVIHYKDGAVLLVGRDGKTRRASDGQLGLFGLEAYRK